MDMEKNNDTPVATATPLVTDAIRRALIMEALAAVEYDDAITEALVTTLKARELKEGDWLVVRRKDDNKPICEVCWQGDEAFIKKVKGGPDKLPFNEDVYAALLGETTEVLDKEFEDAKLHASAYCRIDLVYD